MPNRCTYSRLNNILSLSKTYHVSANDTTCEGLLLVVFTIKFRFSMQPQESRISFNVTRTGKLPRQIKPTKPMAALSFLLSPKHDICTSPMYYSYKVIKSLLLVLKTSKPNSSYFQLGCASLDLTAALLVHQIMMSGWLDTRQES
jgi:hypothetical protein